MWFSFWGWFVEHTLRSGDVEALPMLLILQHSCPTLRGIIDTSLASFIGDCDQKMGRDNALVCQYAAHCERMLARAILTLKESQLALVQALHGGDSPCHAPDQMPMSASAKDLLRSGTQFVGHCTYTQRVCNQDESFTQRYTMQIMTHGIDIAGREFFGAIHTMLMDTQACTLYPTDTEDPQGRLCLVIRDGDGDGHATVDLESRVMTGSLQHHTGVSSLDAGWPDDAQPPPRCEFHLIANPGQADSEDVVSWHLRVEIDKARVVRWVSLWTDAIRAVAVPSSGDLATPLEPGGRPPGELPNEPPNAQPSAQPNAQLNAQIITRINPTSLDFTMLGPAGLTWEDVCNHASVLFEQELGALRRAANAMDALQFESVDDKKRTMRRLRRQGVTKQVFAARLNTALHVVTNCIEASYRWSGAYGVMLKTDPWQDILVTRQHTVHEELDAAFARLADRVPLGVLDSCRVELTDDAESSAASAEDCSICQLEATTGVVRLPCGHHFHHECISPWCYDHSTCPYCRSSIVQ